MTKEEVEKELEQLLQRKVHNNREVELITGKGGAIEYEVALRIAAEEEASKLSKERRDKIRKEVEALGWKDGMYTISTKYGIIYHGLYDSNVKDGDYVIKRGEKWFIERWSNNLRRGFKEISKEKAMELKNKQV